MIVNFPDPNWAAIPAKTPEKRRSDLPCGKSELEALSTGSSIKSMSRRIETKRCRIISTPGSKPLK